MERFFLHNMQQKGNSILCASSCLWQTLWQKGQASKFLREHLTILVVTTGLNWPPLLSGLFLLFLLDMNCCIDSRLSALGLPLAAGPPPNVAPPVLSSGAKLFQRLFNSNNLISFSLHGGWQWVHGPRSNIVTSCQPSIALVWRPTSRITRHHRLASFAQFCFQKKSSNKL